MRILANIEGENINLLDDGSITWTSKAAIDGDGSGTETPGDTFQADTSLHQNGEPLNSQVDRYIVVPPVIVWAVEGVVMGCQAFVTNTKNGRSSEAVVGDIGPHRKLGEISSALAVALGIDPSPTTGGYEDHVVHYSIIPGRYAVVEGKQYSLQAS